MAGIDDVRALALALPGAEEGTSYRTTAWKVRGTLFARLRDDDERLVVFCDFIEREALLQSGSPAYELTDHYRDYPMILIRLAAIGRDELEEMLVESWRHRAPKRMLAAYDAEHPPA
ncbi:hypothetical protein HJD18_05555 [Thermoleophilia bacterium SCSIO 60948]|nr:hypothetical protein HJD18_05555 [Thermoleophilia bacterium SCSIO 60948]